MSLTEIVLVCTIINCGIALGAGLYETRMVLPLWFNKHASSYSVNFGNMRAIDSGRRFWAFVTTLPLTILMIINLVLSLQSPQPLHGWWVAASVILLTERASTFAFFIPTAIKLQKGESLPPAKASKIVTSWLRLNYVRNALTLATLGLFIKALIMLQVM